MRSLLDKFFFRSNNLDKISKRIRKFTQKTPVKKIFDAVENYNSEGEIRYVGGCIRKIINNEKVDDIDLATTLKPNQVCDALKKNNIKYYETGFEHGTVTAKIDDWKFEITTLRKDILTDGRHAKVEFSKNWKQDASRRDFTINAIYSDENGNLFDPYNGIIDLDNGIINFIGNPDLRIKEDYLRILRYLRFFLNYSKQQHNLEIIKKIKLNLGGISKLSKERLLEELKKILDLKTLEKINNDKHSQDLILMIFPEFINIKIFSKLKSYQKELLQKIDFIFLLCLLIIDQSDNADYFIYKFNLSKKDQKRIKTLNNFFKDKNDLKNFKENNLNKVFYYNGKQAVIDILYYKIINLKKIDKKLLEMVSLFQDKKIIEMPIGADLLMSKYKIPEGRLIGLKLKKIEEKWVNNDFKISDQQINEIIKN